MAQRLELPLGTRVQVMPGGLDVPVSVSREAVVAMTRSVVPGLPHAEATKSGSPRLIAPQIGAVSTMVSGGTAPSEPVLVGASTAAGAALNPQPASRAMQAARMAPRYDEIAARFAIRSSQVATGDPHDMCDTRHQGVRLG